MFAKIFVVAVRVQNFFDKLNVAFVRADHCDLTADIFFLPAEKSAEHKNFREVMTGGGRRRETRQRIFTRTNKRLKGIIEFFGGDSQHAEHQIKNFVIGVDVAVVPDTQNLCAQVVVLVSNVAIFHRRFHRSQNVVHVAFKFLVEDVLLKVANFFEPIACDEIVRRGGQKFDGLSSD